MHGGSIAVLTCLALCACVEPDPLYCTWDGPCPFGHVCSLPARECVPLFPDLCPGDGAAVETRTADLQGFATSALKLPSPALGFSLDIDGDSRPDNQLKAVIGALAAAFDLQGPVDAAVQAGTTVLLIELQAPGLDYGCARASLSLAQKTLTPPRFNGSDTFVRDTSSPPAVLWGRLIEGKMSSVLPRDQRRGPVQGLPLALALTMGTLPLPLYGVHVQGIVSPSGILDGEIHGVIHKTDIDDQIVPAVARVLTEQVRQDPMSSTAETIIRLFEDLMGLEASQKKCMDTPNKCCATPATRMTCEILPEEVRQNPIVGNVLAPDVEVFEGDAWGPVPRGTMKDAMSVGFGFTAVKATF
jgi:hypothetical protein